MQADVQRNVNQQQRIEQGIQSGQLTTARPVSSSAARRGSTGPKRGRSRRARGPNEQRRIQKAENRQSKRIYRESTTRKSTEPRKPRTKSPPASVKCGGLFFALAGG